MAAPYRITVTQDVAATSRKSAYRAAVRLLRGEPLEAALGPPRVAVALADSQPEQFTVRQIIDRATIVFESDAVCEGCGADPRAADGAAIADPAWQIDMVRPPEAREQVSDDGTRIAEVLCPRCL